MANLYDFDTCVRIIERKGKEFYGEQFRIYQEDHDLIAKLLAYILKDEETCMKNTISLKKGILLTGPVGCGKTTLMNLLRLFQPGNNRYIMKSCRDVSFEFIQEGYSVILKYGKQAFNQDKPKMYCFDDLGTENNLKYYGNECNVMTEILLSRYDMFVSRQMITHITTNLNSSEIESLYGIRVRSRMREMFNLVSFEKEARDKRV
ncbi:MAG: AAA family ATPase [Bacteroidales bacterium]|nr:AAA family ATPase [Bacteroidales bacterium]